MAFNAILKQKNLAKQMLLFKCVSDAVHIMTDKSINPYKYKYIYTF